jgi:hypothetical protein
MTGVRRVPPGFFDDALREANVCHLHLFFNALTNMLSVAHSSIPIPCAAHPNTTSTYPQSLYLSLAPLQATWGNWVHHPIPIPTFQLDRKPIWYTTQTGSIGHPVARGRGPLHRVQACAFFSLSQFFFIVDSSHRRPTTQERRSQLPAYLDLPILIPHNNPAEQHKVHHRHHLQLLLPRHPPLSLVLLEQQEQFCVLISPVLDGALVSWPGSAACPFRTQTVTISEATFLLSVFHSYFAVSSIANSHHH